MLEIIKEVMSELVELVLSKLPRLTSEPPKHNEGGYKYWE